MTLTAYGAIYVSTNSRFKSSEVVRAFTMARNDRARLRKQTFGPTPIVMSGLAVTWSGSGLTVTVATGEGMDGDGLPIYVPSTVPSTNTEFGNPAEGTQPQRTLAAADPSNPRIDIIYARSNTLLTDYDSVLTSDGTTVSPQVLPQTTMDYFTLGVVQGTPAGSPTAPAALLATDLVLAEIAVPAAAAAISDANITDRRNLLTVGGAILYTSALPTASATYRGTTAVLAGASGAPDTVYICLKQADGTYNWYPLA